MFRISRESHPPTDSSLNLKHYTGFLDDLCLRQSGVQGEDLLDMGPFSLFTRTLLQPTGLFGGFLAIGFLTRRS